MRLNTERRELATEFTDSELDAVSGGEGNLPMRVSTPPPSISRITANPDLVGRC